MNESRIQISVCSAEGSAGCGAISRLEIQRDGGFFAGLEAALRGAPAWSPILWEENDRRADNFEAAGLIALDWELPGKPVFPRAQYTEPDRLRAFISSLRSPAVPLPDYAHTTTHGLRLLFVLSDLITEPETYSILARRLCLDYGADLQATDLARVFAAARHLQDSFLLEVEPNDRR